MNRFIQKTFFVVKGRSRLATECETIIHTFSEPFSTYETAKAEMNRLELSMKYHELWIATITV